MANVFGKRQKYGNKKVISVDGTKFDSKLESYLHGLLTIHKIEFDFQVDIELQNKFRYRGELIRPIKMRIDFVIKHNGETYYIDTKGFATPEAKLKFKMLKHILKDGGEPEVLWLHNKKEVESFVNRLISNI